jgi:hypothetical protein
MFENYAVHLNGLNFPRKVRLESLRTILWRAYAEVTVSYPAILANEAMRFHDEITDSVLSSYRADRVRKQFLRSFSRTAVFNSPAEKAYAAADLLDNV